ncbi:hypothetical protein DSO57_1010835 [Entomophthora muscae]|uniref:Uncharacterized protein n=1 Tax=Entomophthora muscae TaxID=34485 RepID=A0ACC2RXL1_9FUNG|nr:hypothetical protein DSO57_1010835 [Entomophthora muscae]
MCSDLINLGSLKNMPIPAQLGYFIEILRTSCNLLNLANESQYENPEPDNELLKMECSLGCILIDIIDILPPSTHVMISSNEQFRSTVLFLSSVNPISNSLLESMIHCIRVISPPATSCLESIFKNTQYATPSSLSILLKYTVNVSNLFPSPISYAVLAQDPLFQFKDITGKQS